MPQVPQVPQVSVVPLASIADSHAAITDLDAIPSTIGIDVKNPSLLKGTPRTSVKYVGAQAPTILNSQRA